MTKKPRPSEPAHGEGPSRHRGTGQHGWSPDVDETRQQENPSARRSFRTEEYGGDRGPGRTKSKEETRPVPGDTVRSDSTRGEEYGDSGQKGHRSTGRKGRSGRPSGTRDASGVTGVDPQDSQNP
ncbi:hypothetical protein [Streptomyces sp. NBC_00582]|uniref:hypothetical protein n=1 Tax=Streptomyces sp. NBC_00582 TaxID=2975783 RepID=UPI0010635A2F|nr:hypothetical protein [Streptomyces sp. NBC_00582]WUB63105.1 hypothetical protein OG852_23200 [Streptomyces sp. NBC_00582]